MEFTVAQIAGILGGEIEGNPDAVVNTLSKIEEGQEKSLTFLANPAYTDFIYSTNPKCVMVLVLMLFLFVAILKKMLVNFTEESLFYISVEILCFKTI